METGKNIDAYPVLLAGGSGSRLWPVSRELFPKQLVNLVGKESLIQSTIKRLFPVLEADRVRVVCGMEHYSGIRQHLTDIDISPESKIITEPCGRNTAPAILLAMMNILRNDKDAILLVFPADHVIRDVSKFQDDLRSAIRLAEKDYIVTFGITPDYPETGYGYIEGGIPAKDGAFVIKRFVEKPDEKTAEHYIEAGNFFWNSGMFAFKASVMMEEFKTNEPVMFECMKKIIKESGSAKEDLYRELPNISIDCAVMEKTVRGVVLPSDFGWSDIGSWKSLYDILPKDSSNNVVNGDVVLRDTKNCFIKSGKRLVVANGLENILVVETSDAVFISGLNDCNDVKEIVTELKAQDRSEYKVHLIEQQV